MGLTIAATSVEMQLADPPTDLENEAYALWAKEQFDTYIDKMSKGMVNFFLCLDDCLKIFSTEENIEKQAPTQTYEALRRKYTDSCIRSLATTKKCGKCKQTIKRYTLYQCKFVMPLSKVEVAEKFE